MCSPASLPGFRPFLAIALLGLFGLAATPPPAPQKNISSVFVRAEHLNALRTKFRSNFRVFDAGTYTTIGNDELSVQWGDLSALIPTTRPDSVADYGVRFQYGLDSANNIALGLEIVRLVKVNDKSVPYVNDADAPRMYRIAPINSSFYAVANGHLVSAVRKSWMDTYHARYMANVCLKRTDEDASFDRYRLYLDASSEVFPWDMELGRMGQENAVTPTEQLRIASIADCSGWIKGSDGVEIGSDYQHALCLYFEGKIGDSVSFDFNRHGANLGTLCPSRCDVYIQPFELP